jgi:hypothetical protein
MQGRYIPAASSGGETTRNAVGSAMRDLRAKPTVSKINAALTSDTPVKRLYLVSHYMSWRFHVLQGTDNRVDLTDVPYR